MSDTTDQGNSVFGVNVTPGPATLFDDFMFLVLAAIVGGIAWEMFKWSWNELGKGL